ncbi:MAG TPA: hypothetical protein VKB12_06245 [Pyrinomonadaceae bacterium]|nr:hypothetical protein [Pyrinomonadaceae bacterium]
MNFPHSRSKSAICLAVVLLTFGLISSCTPPSQQQQQQPPACPNPKDELTRSLKGANVDGYIFETREDDAGGSAFLTNGVASGPIKLDPGTNNLVLRYASLREKNSNAAKTYKTELIRSGDALTLQVTDINTGEAVVKDTSDPPTGGGGPTCPQTFDNLDACQCNFDATRRPALQAEANRTCKPQQAALLCCLKGGQFVSVHYFIRPTRLRCLLADTIPDLGGIVLSSR